MNTYIKTEETSCKELNILIPKYFREISKDASLTPKANNYFVENYKISLEDALSKLAEGIRVNEVEENLYQIYFQRNIVIKGKNIEDVANFLEYGNLEIKPAKLITIIFNAVIKKIRIEERGGM